MNSLKQIFSLKSVTYDGFLAYSTGKKLINSAIPAIHTASFLQNLTASHLSSYALLILLVLCQEKEVLTDFVLFPCARSTHKNSSPRYHLMMYFLVLHTFNDTFAVYREKILSGIPHFHKNGISQHNFFTRIPLYDIANNFFQNSIQKGF